MSTSREILARLLDAIEGTFHFVIGVIEPLPGVMTPCIQVYHADGDREWLRLVRDAIRRGLQVTIETPARVNPDESRVVELKPPQPACGSPAPSTGRILLATRETVTASVTQPEDTAALRVPAWMVTLEALAPAVIEVFERGRREFGGFLLVVQTPGWEFAAWVSCDGGIARVEPVRAREWPAPPAAE